MTTYERKERTDIMPNPVVVLYLNHRQRIEISKTSERGSYVAEYYSLDAWTARNVPGAVPVIIKTELIKGGLRAVEREVHRAKNHGFVAEWRA